MKSTTNHSVTQNYSLYGHKPAIQEASVIQVSVTKLLNNCSISVVKSVDSYITQVILLTTSDHLIFQALSPNCDGASIVVIH